MKNFYRIIYIFSFIILFTNYSVSETPEEIEKNIKNLPLLLNTGNAGTLFYMTFLPCWEESGTKNSIKIYVASAVKTMVTMKIPGLAIERSKEVNPYDVVEFTLSPAEALPYSKGSGALAIKPKPEQIWDGRGIIITSDDPIICYGVTRFQYTSDGYLALPVSVLGKSYQVASYSDPTNNTQQYLPSYTGIVGVFDNTKVTFRLGGSESSRVEKQDGDTLRSGEAIKRTMNAGDVWLIAGIGPFNDLTGSRITSTNPVAVVSGNFCAYIPSHVAACDFIAEMEIPETAWGTRYHVTPIVTRKNYSIIKIFAAKPYTQVYMEGLPMWTISTPGGNLGSGFIETRAGVDDKPRPVVVNSDEGYPINVVQYNPGQDDDGIKSDPFQLQLTPIQQYQNEIIFNTPGIKGGFGFSSNYLNIVYKATVDGGIPDDMMFGEAEGGKINWMQLNQYSSNPGLQFTKDIPDKNNRYYYSKTLMLPSDGIYALKADEKFASYSYGFSDYDSYGFPTGVSAFNIAVPDTLPPSLEWQNCCCGANYFGKVIDEPRADEDNTSGIAIIKIDKSKSYNFRFNYKPFYPGVLNSIEWTLDVIDPSMNAEAHLRFVDASGNRTDTVFIYKAVDAEIVEYYSDYGKLKLEKPTLSKVKTFTLRNNSDNDLTSERYGVYLIMDSQIKEDKNDDIFGYQNFELIGVKNLDLTPLLKGEEIKFEVMFTATSEGYFRDSIGIVIYDKIGRDTCKFAYFTELNAFVGNAYIIAEDHDFGSCPLKVRTSPVTLRIHNPQNSDYKASTGLRITGYIYSGDKVGMENSGETFEIKGLENISTQHPLVIPPGAYKEFQVTFNPTQMKQYSSVIEFIADASIPDNKTILTGKAVMPGISSNSVDWGSKLADINFYKKDLSEPVNFIPYKAAYNAIKVTNAGETELTITEAKIVDIKGPNRFLIEHEGALNSIDQNLLDQIYVGKNLKLDETIQYTAYFHPVSDEFSLLTIEFVTKEGVSTQSTLRGKGIYPKSFSDSLHFAKLLANFDKAKGEIRFYNQSWQSSANLEIFKIKSLMDDESLLSDNSGYGIFRIDTNKITDMDGNIITLPFIIAEDEYISVPVSFVPNKDGNFEALISIESSSEEEPVALISGSAEIENFKAEGSRTGTCLYSASTLNNTIKNTGTIPFKITSYQIKFSDNDNTSMYGDFIFDKQLPVTINPDETVDLPVKFNPSIIYNDVHLFLILKTDLRTNPEISIPMLVNSYNYTFETASDVKIKNNREKIEIGADDALTYHLYLQTDDVDGFNPSSFVVKIEFDNRYLGLAYYDYKREEAKINLGSYFKSNGYEIMNIDRNIDNKSKKESLTINLKSNNSINLTKDTRELLSVSFNSYFPNFSTEQDINISKSLTIKGDVNINYSCLNTSPTEVTAEVDSTCVDRIRPVSFSRIKYSLAEINPNPVSNEIVDIGFSIGGNNIPTKINLYNSEGKLIDTIINGNYSSGRYNVTLSTANFSNGYYILEMVAGPFQQNQKLIISK